MLKRLTIITGTILLASAAWAEVLDKASSLGVAQDATTGIWTLECLSEVTGISRLDAHNVGASVQIADGTGAITIFSIQKDMLPAERRVTESAEGVYDFEMKKAGNRIKVGLFTQAFCQGGLIREEGVDLPG